MERAEIKIDHKSVNHHFKKANAKVNNKKWKMMGWNNNTDYLHCLEQIMQHKLYLFLKLYYYSAIIWI